MNANFSEFRKIWQRCGTMVAMANIADRTFGRSPRVQFLVIRVHYAIPGDIRAPHLPTGYSVHEASPEELALAVAANPVTLSGAFVASALAKGDRCFGVFFDERMVSFQWYATTETHAFDDVSIAFSPSYYYAYKAETEPAHRGKGLHSAAMAVAIGEYARSGLDVMVAYIRGKNGPSLLSGVKLGNVSSGIAIVWRVGTGFGSWQSRLCTRVGLKFATTMCSSKELNSTSLNVE